MICELFSFLQECDIPNWLTMVIELTLGGLVAGLFFWKQKKQGDKIQSVVDKTKDQQTSISNLISEIKILEEKQNTFVEYQTDIQRKSKEYAYYMIYSKLVLTHSALNVLKMIKEKSPEIKNLDRQRYVDEVHDQVHEIETILNSFGMLIEKDLIWDIMMVVRNATDTYYHLNQLDEVISMTEKARNRIEKLIPKSYRDFTEHPYLKKD